MRDEYRDDTGPEGMQAQAAQGTPADRVQSVIADEAYHNNENAIRLINAILLMAKSIATLVGLIAVFLIYSIFTNQ